MEISIQALLNQTQPLECDCGCQIVKRRAIIRLKPNPIIGQPPQPIIIDFFRCEDCDKVIGDAVNIPEFMQIIEPQKIELQEKENYSPTQQLINFIIERKLELKDYPKKLKPLLQKKFIITDGLNDLDQTKHLIDVIIDWENNTEIHTSLETLLKEKFIIKMRG